MIRTDLNIKNATRIIIKRDSSWRTNSRLYNIEVRWDYDNTFAKYAWNNERYQLPQVITNKVAHVDTRILAIACSRFGLMYKTRFEQDITKEVYLEIWRKDLRDNVEEQRRLTLGEVLSNSCENDIAVIDNTFSNEIIDSIVSDEVSIHNESIVVNIVSNDTSVKEEEELVFDCFD